MIDQNTHGSRLQNNRQGVVRGHVFKQTDGQIFLIERTRQKDGGDRNSIKTDGKS